MMRRNSAINTKQQYCYQSIKSNSPNKDSEMEMSTMIEESFDYMSDDSTLRNIDIIKYKQANNDTSYEKQKSFDLLRAKGLMWMMISALMTTLMNIIIKVQSQSSEVGVLQAVIIRAFFLALGCFLHLKKDKKSIIDIPEPMWKFILMRAFFGFCSGTSFFLAIEYLPLSMAVSLYFTSPILTALVCYFSLDEKLTKLEIIGIFSAMFGVVMLTCPELFFTPSTKTTPRLMHFEEDVEYTNYTLGVFLALFGSLTNAFVFLVCRKLGKEVHQALHPFYFAVVTIIGGVVAISASSYEINPMTGNDIIMLSLCGIFSFVQQEGQSIALQHEKGGRIAAINYLVVFNSFIFDALIYGETVKFSDWMGAFFIIIFTLTNACMKCYGKNS